MADTRLRYTGPIDGVELAVGTARVVVARLGDIDLADHATAKEAAALAAQLVANGDWTPVQLDKTKGDAPGGDK